MEEERIQKLREEGSKAKKNTSNVAYDILTLQYAQNKDGEQQKYVDDMVRYRAGEFICICNTLNISCMKCQ
ncbi:hypothetical protein EON64_06110 [archaeon]|nr:MAG: hypothetical protein EON64_06110 [archaeon]